MNECSNLKPTPWTPWGFPEYILDFCLMLIIYWHVWWSGFFLKKCISCLNFPAVSFLHMPVLICGQCVLCLASALLAAPLCARAHRASGSLLVCCKEVWKILLPEPSGFPYWGWESYQGLPGWQSDNISPHTELKQLQWGWRTSEDQWKRKTEITAHRWQMVEVWLEIGLLRNILS